MSAASLDALLSDQAWRFGDRVYLEAADGPHRLTFAGLDAACHRMARLLAARGVGAGDRVSILCGNGPAFVAVFLGVQRVGAVANPINVEVNAKNLAQILHDVDPRLIVSGSALADELSGVVAATGVERLACTDDELDDLLAPYPATPVAPAPLGPDDLAVIDYTSGTTARPKGVCIGRRAFSLMCEAPAERFGFTADDRVLEYRSLAWASPQLLGLGATLHAGATLVLAPKFSHSRFFEWIAAHRVTIAVGVPTVITMLLERPVAAAIPTLKFLTSSAAPLAPERQRDFEARYGVPIVQGCGMTEAGFMAGNPPAVRRAGSIGPPMPRVSAWFADDDGRRCRPGQDGELVVSGPQMATAYLVERARLEPIPRDRFPTGDIGHADADGYLYLTGRKKDLIIKGGVNVAPLEVTTALLSHPDVADAATIGVADAVYGETIVSAVVVRTGARVTADALLDHCRARLSPFKLPATVAIVDAIPKTPNGKVAGQALRALLSGASARPL